MLLKIRDILYNLLKYACLKRQIRSIRFISVSLNYLQTTCCRAVQNSGHSREYTSVAAFNVLIRANALPLSITIITVATPSPVNETNISSANINDNDFAPEIC